MHTNVKNRGVGSDFQKEANSASLGAMYTDLNPGSPVPWPRMSAMWVCACNIRINIMRLKAIYMYNGLKMGFRSCCQAINPERHFPLLVQASPLSPGHMFIY